MTHKRRFEYQTRFWMRVLDAIHRLRCGHSHKDIQCAHGGIVLRYALRGFSR